MRYWDTSAVVAAFLGETRLWPLLQEPRPIVVSWYSSLSCVHALTARGMPVANRRRLTALLKRLLSTAYEVQPVETLRHRATRVMEIHGIAPEKALEIACALILVEERTEGVEFVSVDEEVRDAASLEGFTVVPTTQQVQEVYG